MNKNVIEVLNRAIVMYKDENHQPLWGDVVVRYNADACKIASYINRHPGCIKMPATLKEGTGYIFLKEETTKLGNKVYLCWEEDNIMRPLEDLCDNLDERKIVHKELRSIIMNAILK